MSYKINCFCELMDQPVGIDCPKPRFSWNLEPAPAAGEQSAYRIRVSESESMEILIWDTGRVCSAQNLLVPYEGSRLKSGTRYYYQITVYTEEVAKPGEVSETGETAIPGETAKPGAVGKPGDKAKREETAKTGKADGIGESVGVDGEGGIVKETYTSEPCSFVTGILDSGGWENCWISCTGMADQAFYIRTSIPIDRPVKAAAAFVTSPNYYLLRLNGHACGDLRLNNACTDYRKTLLYETHPLELQIGENILGIELGNGWINLETQERKVAKREFLIAVRIRIEYADGVVEWLESGRDRWFFSNMCPVTDNHIYHGERYDARREQAGWDRAGFRMEPEGNWKQVFEADSPGGEILAQRMEPIRVTETLLPAAVYPLGEGCYTVDFGQNFAGWVRLCTSGPAGTQITIRFAELSREDHTVNSCSLKEAQATDTFILKGEGNEIFEPHFTYHGFRYVQISGLAKPLAPEHVTGCVVRTDAEYIGGFHCSHELVNRFYHAVVWTEKSNQHGLPTDCPQRSERLGWLNDMTVRSDGALYNFRLPQMYHKWTRDIRDTQGKNSGAIADTAPFFHMGQRPADAVSSSYLLVPWNVYCHYADTTILSDNYEGGKRWTEYLKRHSEHYIISASHMGDWASPKKWCVPGSIGGGAVSTVTPPELMGTGYLFYNYVLLEKMAKVLGKPLEAREFALEAKRVCTAFMERFYDPTSHRFAQNSQTSNAFPLYLGMVNEVERPYVLKNLVADIMEENDCHLTTGNLGTRYALEVLFENGYVDEAFSILTQTSYPSWGYMLENGATTLWERWEKIEEDGLMASYNHPMTGAAGVCLHKYILGIRPDEKKPAFRNILIKPCIPTQLDSASGQIRTIRGTVACAWEKKKDRFILQLKIPFNCTADVRLPVLWPGPCESIHRKNGEIQEKMQVKVQEGNKPYHISAGLHQFELYQPVTHR